jgi:tetratricopeptide (TPR) repeat protein
MRHTGSAQTRAHKLVKVGDIAKDCGDLAHARAQYEKALRLAPDLPAAMCGLAAVEGREGNLPAAEALLRAVIASSAPSSVRAGASIALANGLFSQGSWDEAFDSYANALSIDITETYPGERDWLTAHAYGGMGAVEARRENIVAAAELYTTALQHAPDHAPTLANLALLYDRMNRPAAAIHALTKALALEPERGEWWFDLGDIYRDAGKPHMARRAYEWAIDKGEEGVGEALAELPPETPDQWYETGREYVIAGDAANAAHAFRLALALGDKRAEAKLRKLGEEPHT